LIEELALFTPQEWEAIALSLRVATAATLALLPVSTAIAYLLARKEFYGKTLLDLFVHVPLVIPPVVTGFILLALFGRKGPIGSALEACCNIVLAFRWTGAVLAAAVMSLPLMVRAIRLSFEAVDAELLEASADLGASRWRTFRSVLLPLSLPGIIAGSVLCFAKALGEFGATITFVSNIPGETQTLPSLIYTFTQVPGGDANTYRLAAVSIAISFAALALSELLSRRAKTLIGRRSLM
jgi:molybdate transport system permease protein